MFEEVAKDNIVVDLCRERLLLHFSPENTREGTFACTTRAKEEMNRRIMIKEALKSEALVHKFAFARDGFEVG